MSDPESTADEIIDGYLAVMHEIKLRLQSINDLGHSASRGDVALGLYLDFGFLQIRKVCELVALACAGNSDIRLTIADTSASTDLEATRAECGNHLHGNSYQELMKLDTSDAAFRRQAERLNACKNQVRLVLQTHRLITADGRCFRITLGDADTDMPRADELPDPDAEPDAGNVAP
jgi:hypothetical protein